MWGWILVMVIFFFLLMIVWIYEGRVYIQVKCLWEIVFLQGKYFRVEYMVEEMILKYIIRYFELIVLNFIKIICIKKQY